MNEEKLEKAANQYLEQVGEEWSSYYSFCEGAEWMQNQPLVDRLTYKERNSIIADYNEDVCEDDYNDGYKAALRNIFGEELFCQSR